MNEKLLTTRAILFVLFGPLVWGLHMTLSYAGHASLCAAGERLPLVSVETLPWLFGALGAAGVLALAWSVVFPRQLRSAFGMDEGESDFLTGLMRVLAGLALLGVTYATIAILILPNCLQLR